MQNDLPGISIAPRVIVSDIFERYFDDFMESNEEFIELNLFSISSADILNIEFVLLNKQVIFTLWADDCFDGYMTTSGYGYLLNRNKELKQNYKPNFTVPMRYSIYVITRMKKIILMKGDGMKKICSSMDNLHLE